jgi:hypothetical protein
MRLILSGTRAIIYLAIFLPAVLFAQSYNEDSAFIVNNYIKIERMISMRDGVQLFTAVYIPKDNTEKHPFLMERTPYSCAPYGENNMSWGGLTRNNLLEHENYIFVFQDVRGRYKSEGSFEEMTPAKDLKKTKKDTDESSDTFDTIEWLLKNIKNNNGRVGIYGISYPGFYASASLPDAHPAIKAVSPQAPVTDEFIGDDAYHNGAFFLLDNFDFTNYFQGTRIDSGAAYKDVFLNKRKDAFTFFKTMEPLKNTNGGHFFNYKAKIWNEYLEHDTYDDYWKARNIRPHLKNIKPAVLVVGGWFDAEDMFGALRTYEAIGQQTQYNNNKIVLGPWTHGGWSESEWKHFGTYDFGQDLNKFYKEEIELKFFNYYLKDKGLFNLPEATVFETGSNQWKQYSNWPPSNGEPVKYYLQADGKISNHASAGFDEYTSDPANPVPYTNGIFAERNNEYLVEDQRFVAGRPDVLVYQTDSLTEDVTVTGRLKADMFISSTGTDADIIVKLIDVLPEYEANSLAPHHENLRMAGFQRLVRAEVFRCKFRNSYEKPEALVPGQITEIKFDMNEIAHKFKKGHRIMVQVQSSWFPIVDINPQKFVNIPTCDKSDFHKATIRIYHDALNSSSVVLPVLH